MGPRSVGLAGVTVHICSVSNFGFCGRELKSVCDMADMLAPVLNSAVVAHCWTIMWYVALIPSIETSLMTTASSVACQFK